MLAESRTTGTGSHHAAAGAAPRFGQIGALLAVLLLAGTAFWLRVDGARSVVFPDTQAPRLLGTDAYDHLRRAAELTATLPPELASRPVTAGDWVRPGLFDAVLALPAMLTGSEPPRIEELIEGAAWVPPVLGALSLLALFALSRRFLPPLDAWFTALLFLLYPGESLERTTLGFADHHAAEILLTLWTLYALVRHVQSVATRPWWRPAFLAPLPALALLMVWRGASMTLGLIVLGLLAVALVELLAGRPIEFLVRRSLAYALGLGGWVACVALLAPNLLPGPVATQRAWLAVGALLLVPVVGRLMATAQRGRLGDSGPWLVVAALGWLALAMAATAVGQRVLEVVTIARTATVSEHMRVEATTVLVSLGTTGLLVLPGLVAGSLALWRGRLDAILLVPFVVAAGWAVLWWAIHDVGYLPPALLAVPAGCALWFLRSWLMRRAGNAEERFLPRRALALSVVPAVVLSLAPLWPYAVARWPGTSPTHARSLVLYQSAHVAAAHWLRDHTPPGAQSPVAAPWELGNLVATLGERRPLWARMPTRSAAAWLLAPTEEQALEVMTAAAAGDAVRYVVIGGRNCGSYFVAAAGDAGVAVAATAADLLRLGAERVPLWRFGPEYTESFALRLCFGGGADLTRHRLLWESPSRVVTAYRMTGFLSDSPGGRQVRLETRPLAALEPEPLAGDVEVSSDGRSILYAPRVHAEVRVFEIVPAASPAG